eukprot:TRINITY_DN28182_c0_g1_i1.p1 TRINITY_DN28182_c0_g1~~TRINITY_DN28182_c0_g1_i1.p1  ORF type:complete len:474 (-),score=72.67 TRINITY_DN28182_c0_g1_i1:19-1440(-)
MAPAGDEHVGGGRGAGCLSPTLPPTKPNQRQDGANFALTVLTVVNLLNFADRYVPNAVKSLFSEELKLDDYESSLPTTGMVLVYMVSAVIFGWLNDKQVVDRRVLLAGGVLFWSFATMLAGFAWNLVSLVAFRALVGVGEAAYTTIAPALISDFYPHEDRSRAFSAFGLAMPLGGALGFGIGSLIGSAYGWRAAYCIAGVPGVLAVLMVLRLKDPARGINDREPPSGISKLSLVETRADSGVAASAFHDTLRILGNWHWLIAVCGLTANSFAVGGLAEWYDTYLIRYNGCSTAEAGLAVGAVTVLGGIGGNLLGLKSARLLESRGDSVYFLVCALYTIPGTFFTHMAVSVSGNKPLSYFYVLAAEVCFFTSLAPMATLTMTVMPVELRARSSGLQIFILHILGDVISPPIIGYLSDSLGLQAAMQVCWVAIAVSGFFWFCGYFCLPRPQILHALPVRSGSVVKRLCGRDLSRK